MLFLAFHLQCGPGTHNGCFFPSYLIIILNMDLFAITLHFTIIIVKATFSVLETIVNLSS